METHHHSNLPHQTKPWKEYLIEYIMIVLAVSTGFIAESIREKKSDHEREKQYLSSMKEDLKMDTASLSYIIRFNENKVKEIDSLLEIVGSDIHQINKKRFYLKCSSLYAFVSFIPTDRTMSQLKNAGGLRLISDQKISDTIILYDAYNRSVKEEGEILKQNNLSIINLLGEMGSLKVVKKYGFAGLQKAAETEFELNTSQQAMNKLYNQCYYLQQVINAYIAYLKGDKIIATDLIAFLNKEGY